MRACGSRCLSCSIFVRLKEPVIKSAMSHPLAGLFHISSLPVHHSTQQYLDSADLLQEDTVHHEQLPQEALPKTSASAIRAESNAKESLSLLNYESARNLRPNTPTGYEPKELTSGEIAAIPTISGSSLGDIYQLCDVHRENWENKINNFQLWKKRGDLAMFERHARVTVRDSHSSTSTLPPTPKDIRGVSPMKIPSLSCV